MVSRARLLAAAVMCAERFPFEAEPGAPFNVRAACASLGAASRSRLLTASSGGTPADAGKTSTGRAATNAQRAMKTSGGWQERGVRPAQDRQVGRSSGLAWRWLVHSEPAASRQLDRGHKPPSLVGHLVFDECAFRAQLADRRVDVVAHQVELAAVAAVVGMGGELRRWQLEDQPPAPGVDEREPEDIGEERPVSLAV